MELKYRGATYKPSGEGEPMADAESMGVARRPRTDGSQSVKTSLRKPGEELIYRGVRYTR
jgi:hypothetical protein